MFPRQWNRYVVLGFALASLVVLAALWFGDPIESLRLELAARSYLGSSWQGGFAVLSPEPPTTPPRDVLAHYLDASSSRLIELREITIPSPAQGNHRYWAARARLSEGQEKIYLFQHRADSGGTPSAVSGYWWIKSMD